MLAISPTDLVQVDWPENSYGETALKRFTVTEQDATLERIRSFTNGGRGVRAGTYTGLYIRSTLWMSDTPHEQRDHLGFLYAVHHREARRVLVNGLGLGMVIRALAAMPHVEHIDVCDNHPDVIGLVAPLVTQWGIDHGTIVNVVYGDAHEPAELYPRGIRWDAAWHDIWRDICGDNWESMKTLRRRYARRCDYQDCWSAMETKRALAWSKRSCW
jgi:hypothetical protein